MISVEEHLETVLALAGPLSPAEVSLTEARGLVLTEDLTARLSVPPFDNSAMDGFAVRAGDLTPGAVLEVVGEVAAGSSAEPVVGAGQAARIMTGGRVPPGADAVVPVEQTDQPLGAAPLPQRVTITEAVPVGRHVRRAGDDVPTGALVLRRGDLLTPAALAAAASIGYGAVPVIPRPRVAVVATGAELAAPGEPLAPGQIPDSNGLMLAGLAVDAGAEVVAQVRVPDDPTSLTAALADLAQDADLILTSGGVSVGAYDVVRQVGSGLSFSSVAMQPGKPQGCGRVAGADGREVPVLAFPGNPVSAFVSFLVFGRPLLQRLAGRTAPETLLFAPALEGWSSPPGRRQFVPVKLVEGGCRPAHRLGSGSHLIASLHLADALAVVGEDVTTVAAGDRLSLMEV